jgi:hypothetical protein
LKPGAFKRDGVTLDSTCTAPHHQLLVHTQDFLTIDFKHQPAHDGFIQHRVRLGAVEDEVQLALVVAAQVAF